MSNHRPKITARDLAWWAEAADGLRGKPLVVTATTKKNAKGQKKVSYEVKVKNSHVKAEDVILDGIQDEPDPDIKMARPAKVVVHVKVKGEKDPREIEVVELGADALFWTPSSIQKFMYTYYAAQRLLTEDDWKKVKKSLRSGRVVAVAHFPPSHGRTIDIEGQVGVLITNDSSVGLLKVQWLSLNDYVATL